MRYEPTRAHPPLSVGAASVASVSTNNSRSRSARVSIPTSSALATPVPMMAGSGISTIPASCICPCAAGPDSIPRRAASAGARAQRRGTPARARGPSKGSLQLGAAHHIFSRSIHADHASRRLDESGGKQRDVACPASGVQDRHPGSDAGTADHLVGKPSKVLALSHRSLELVLGVSECVRVLGQGAILRAIIAHRKAMTRFRRGREAS